MSEVLAKNEQKMRADRYKENPFLEEMTIPVKKSQVRVSRLGKDDNVLLNQATGEILGTHVTTFKKVDSEQFIKVFTANIGMTFDLTAAGIKAFSVLLWAVQNAALGKDEVDLDMLALDDFLAIQKNKLKLSQGTFLRGLSELCHARIIAKTMRKGRYFINPNFVFNGDRIAFTTLIEKKKREDETLDLFNI